MAKRGTVAKRARARAVPENDTAPVYNPEGPVAEAAYNLVAGKVSGDEWVRNLRIWGRGSEAEQEATLDAALTEVARAEGLVPPTDTESLEQFYNRQITAVRIANGHFGPVAQVRVKGPGYHLVKPLLDALAQRCSRAEARFLAAWRETPGERPAAIAARLGYRHPEHAGPAMLTRLSRRAATL